MIISGISDYQNSKKLIAQGKQMTAEVVNSFETVSRRSRTHNYYLVVRFQPDGAEAVTRKKSVSKDAFDAGTQSQTTPVVYLPSDPKIFQVGEKATTQTSGIIVGSLFFAGGLAFLFYLWSQRNKPNVEENVQMRPAVEPELKKAA